MHIINLTPLAEGVYNDNNADHITAPPEGWAYIPTEGGPIPEEWKGQTRDYSLPSTFPRLGSIKAEELTYTREVEVEKEVTKTRATGVVDEDGNIEMETYTEMETVTETREYTMLTVTEMTPLYQNHYITVDDEGRITGGWSDGPNPDRDTTGAVLLTDQGGYQFRLYPDGEDDPELKELNGIPMYKWDGAEAIRRTGDEMEVDRTALRALTYPPNLREHAGDDGLVKPVWDYGAEDWAEGATAEEIAAWELEHPAPPPTEEEVRAKRDKLLAETDWTQVLDAPIDDETRAAYRVYRQALRDVPEQEGFPENVVWPELPAVVKADPDPVDEVVDVLLEV